MIMQAALCPADMAGRLVLSAINLQQRSSSSSSSSSSSNQAGRQSPTLGNSPLILAYSGAIILHGPHHFAVKFSTDTLSAFTQTT